jgi:glycosyltransferase involved in cell wall biosynthesis
VDLLAVSVVIPSYNRAALVVRAVSSALAAISPEDEILVIDDGSTDDTERALAPFASRIRFVKASHGGAGPARNRGIAESKHGLVAFLDSDDEWLPDKLPLQRGLMQARPDVAYCFSDFAMHDRSGRIFPRYLENWHKDPRPWKEILGPGFPYSSIAALPAGREDFRVYVGDLYASLMAHNYVSTFTLVVRKNIPGGIPSFPEDLATFEDWQFFGDLARRGAGAYLDCETAIQHDHATPRLTDAIAIIKASTRLKLLERIWGSDRAFLALHGPEYRKIFEGQQLRLAKEFLKAGRMREAAATLAAIPAYPYRYRLLVRLPGAAIRALVWAHRKARALLATR